MKLINRMMTNICSEKLEESKVFYTKLFDFRIDYDSDWFIHLISEENNLELGIISKKSEIVPKEAQFDPKGFYITFVINNVDEVFELAKSQSFEILKEPIDTFYGQRQVLLRDPNGVIIDASSPIPNFEP